MELLQTFIDKLLTGKKLVCLICLISFFLPSFTFMSQTSQRLIKLFIKFGKRHQIKSVNQVLLEVHEMEKEKG